MRNQRPPGDVVKKGDTPTLYYRANANLATATSIVLNVAAAGDTAKLWDLPATFEEIDAEGNSLVSVDLTSTQTATVAAYVVELEAVIAGKKYTFPSEGFLRIYVVDDIS